MKEKKNIIYRLRAHAHAHVTKTTNKNKRKYCLFITLYIVYKYIAGRRVGGRGKLKERFGIPFVNVMINCTAIKKKKNK